MAVVDDVDILFSALSSCVSWQSRRVLLTCLRPLQVIYFRSSRAATTTATATATTTTAAAVAIVEQQRQQRHQQQLTTRTRTVAALSFNCQIRTEATATATAPADFNCLCQIHTHTHSHCLSATINLANCTINCSADSGNRMQMHNSEQQAGRQAGPLRCCCCCCCCSCCGNERWKVVKKRQ